MDTVTLLAVFRRRDEVLEAIAALRAQQPVRLVAYSPHPDHDIEHALEKRTSPVRFFTLTGAILGLIGGFFLAIWSSLKWGLVSGGKPVVSIPPFIVVGFEMTILFGALATLIGLIVTHLWRPSGIPGTYDPRFSRDRYGLAARIPAELAEIVERKLRDAGAEEVHVR